MISPKMIENEMDIFCFNGHKQKCISILFDQKLSSDQRFLCSSCLENLDQDAKVIGIRKAHELIFEQQTEKMKQVEVIIDPQIRSIEKVLEQINELKQQLFDSFQQLISGLNNWIISLKQQLETSANFSFCKEIDNFITQQYSIKENIQQLIQEYQCINQSYHTKMLTHLESINKISLDNIQLKKLDSSICSNTELNQDLDIIEQQLKQKSQIKLKQSLQSVIKIDQSTQNLEISFNQLFKCDQKEECNAIAFNYSQQIMISNGGTNIYVWKFDQKKIKPITTLKGHSNQVFCLVFSKLHNSFISGGKDNTIRFWQQQNYDKWISSKPYQEHTDWVMCITFNYSEDLVFSGSVDKSIKIWQVNFKNNQLVYLYSLQKHNDTVISLSLSQSENLLASCAVDKDSIIIWESQYNSKFEFKYFVNQSISAEGSKLLFIKENQFIWITGGKEFDQLLVFEMEEGIFKEQEEKKINLQKNDEIYDEYHFPIVYNNQKNLLLIRHKKFFYLISPKKIGDFSIIKEFKCDSCEIYGTMTNNGSHLVYWNEKQNKYFSHELLKI